VFSGRYFFSPNISEYVVDGFLNKEPDQKLERNDVELSGREKEILQLIDGGVSNKEIASQLNLSLDTIYTHRKNIKKKMDICRQHKCNRPVIKEFVV
jgi:DNA-binding NarL/FixJ family response regulator